MGNLEWLDDILFLIPWNYYISWCKIVYSFLRLVPKHRRMRNSRETETEDCILSVTLSDATVTIYPCFPNLCIPVLRKRSPTSLYRSMYLILQVFFPIWCHIKIHQQSSLSFKRPVCFFSDAYVLRSVNIIDIHLLPYSSLYEENFWLEAMWYELLSNVQHSLDKFSENKLLFLLLMVGFQCNQHITEYAVFGVQGRTLSTGK